MLVFVQGLQKKISTCNAVRQKKDIILTHVLFLVFLNQGAMAKVWSWNWMWRDICLQNNRKKGKFSTELSLKGAWKYKHK